MAVAKKAQVSKDTPRKRGRPTYEPNDIDRAKVDALCATGCPQRLMSWYMQKDIKTLKKHYPDEFVMGGDIKEKTNMVEYSLFYSAAFLHNVTACIVWLKAHKPDLYAEKANSDPTSGEIGQSLLESLADQLPD